MAEPENLAPAITTTTAATDAPRGSGPDRLAQLRAGLSVEQHAKTLAAQAQLAELERKLVELEAIAIKAAAAAAKAESVSQAQQHELALLDRKHALEMEHTQQQWKLTDARQERDRQNAEAQRERDRQNAEAQRERDQQNAEAQREREATIAAEQFAEVRQRCETLSREITSMQAAIAIHGNRITMNSVLIGGAAGLVFTAARASAQSTSSGATKRRRRAKAQPSNAAWAGVGGVATTLAPIALQHMARQTAELPAPTTASGWDEHLMSLIKEHCRLTARLAIMGNQKVSVPTMAVGAVGVALVGYAITG
jgi:hypothetical protein